MTCWVPDSLHVLCACLACCEGGGLFWQVSDQAVRLWQEGWFQGSAEPSGVSTLRNPKVCL